MYNVSYEEGWFVCRKDFSHPNKENYPRHYGWEWNKTKKVYKTRSPLCLAPFVKFLDSSAIRRVAALKREGDENEANANSAFTECHYPIPEGYQYHNYQKKGVELLLGLCERGAYLADEMGLGKTIQCIGVHNVVGGNMVIVCPLSLQINWRNELEMFSTRKPTVVIMNRKTVLPELDGNTVVIISYGSVWRDWASPLQKQKWDLFVADEAHNIKNSKTKAFQGTRALINKAKRKILVSGTPILSRPMEMYHPLRLLNFPDPYYVFGERYCLREYPQVDYMGARNLDELNMRLKRWCMIRRTKEMVQEELPEKTIKLVVLDSDGYKKELALEQEAMKAAEKFEADVSTLKNAHIYEMAEMAKARKQIAIAKINDVVDIAIDTFKSRGQVIIFAHHKDVTAGIEKAIKSHKYTTCIVDGTTPVKRRQEYVESFQKGDIDFFIGNIKAAGVGITLTASSSVIMAEQDWTPGSMDQAFDRAHRIGQKNTVLIQVVVVDGSFDANMAKTLKRKRRIMNKVLA